jgi:DDE superfamily endonuclease
VLKGLERERVDNSVLTQTIEFVNWFNDWFKQKGLSTTVLINADETRVRIEGEQQKGKGIESTQKKKASAIKASAGDAATYIPFHTAEGKMVCGVFVLPLDAKGESNFYLRDLTRGQRGSHPTFYCFTETGWMNSETWVEVLKKLKEILEKKYPGLEPCLLLDKLAVHMQDDALRYCVQNRMHVAFFPAHATHFLQPSDNLLFTVFKKGLYQRLQAALLGVRVNHTDLGAILVAIAQDLEVKLTSSLISASWRNTGLHPWDPKKILTNAETNAGVRSTEAVADSPIGEIARTITQSMLREALGDTTKKKVRIQGPKQKLFSGEEILEAVEMEEKRKAEEQEAKDAKREAKKKAREDAAVGRQTREEKFACRGSGHVGQAVPKWRSGNAWLWCSTCDCYGLCPKCRSRDAAALKQHEDNCKGKNK